MKKDLSLSLIFFLIIFFGSYYLSTFREITTGAEYTCIAEALARGDGFSDPFCSPEGSSDRTAWMPPFWSYLMAGVMVIFGINTMATSIALLFITKAALALALFFLLRLANEINSSYRHVSLLLFLGYILINPGPFLLAFHDYWLIAVASMAIPYVLYFHFIRKTAGIFPVLLLAVLLPLISPVLSLAFVCIVAWLFLQEYYIHWQNHKELSGLFTHRTRSVPRLLLIVSVFLAPAIVWGSRNYMVFDQFIPVKSNLWFDFYQANVFDEDGLPTGFTFANFHPIKNKERLREYQQTGETRLMEPYKQKSLAYLKRQPSDYFRKVSNRMIASFIYAKHPYDEEYKIDATALAGIDVAVLQENKILSENYSLNMQLSAGEFQTKISQLGIPHHSALIQEWHRAKQAYSSEFNSLPRILESGLISGIPFLAWLTSLVLIRKFRRGRELFFILSIFYLSYLLPYAMISTHTRYQIPLSPFFSLLLYFAIILTVNQLNPLLLRKKQKNMPDGKPA